MASTEDREVLQEVWSGRVPTMFSLAEDDCKDTTADSCYLMLPRMSYLPLATEKVKQQQFSLEINIYLAGQETLLSLLVWRCWGDVVLIPWITVKVAPSYRSTV